MRIVLSLLTCFVFLQAQTYAINGGPVTNQDLTATGTFSGLLIPESSGALGGSGGGTGSGFATQTAANSMGLFTFGLPTSGLGSGSFLMFSEGRVYTGTITAFGDPNSGAIQGILQATYDYTLNTPTTVTNPDGSVSNTITNVAVTAGVHGTMAANAEQAAYNPFIINAGTGELISGTATLDIDQGQANIDGTPIITSTQQFVVDGLQQDATPAAPASVTSTAGGTGGTGGTGG
jgi:hypothetical protein